MIEPAVVVVLVVDEPHAVSAIAAMAAATIPVTLPMPETLSAELGEQLGPDPAVLALVLFDGVRFDAEVEGVSGHGQTSV